jgi:hypothetical protein
MRFQMRHQDEERTTRTVSYRLTVRCPCCATVIIPSHGQSRHSQRLRPVRQRITIRLACSHVLLHKADTE